MNDGGFRLPLEEGADALGLQLSQDQIRQLEVYLGLLAKWNRVYNLTAVRVPADMLTHHLLDSLATVCPLQRQLEGRPGKLLDVGSGAGLPGIVLAICIPNLQVTCVDAVEKKMAFVRQAASTLGLMNLSAVHARVESLDGHFDVICSRAFASLADFVRLTGPLLAPDGVWMAMKGKRPDAEIAELARDAQVFHVEPLLVPGLGADRCLVWMRAAKA